MAESQTNVEVVGRAFQAATAGDWDTVRGIVRGDFTWHIPGRSRIAGDAIGIEAFAAKLRGLFESGLEVELLNVMGGGDHVITVQRNRAATAAGDLDITVLNLFTLADGKVVRMQTFPGDQYALDAFWGE